MTTTFGAWIQIGKVVVRFDDAEAMFAFIDRYGHLDGTKPVGPGGTNHRCEETELTCDVQS